MLDLINGEPTDLPKFDFQKGHRVVGRRVQLNPEEPIIIEGIHALNDKLTTAIPKGESSRSSSPRKPKSTSMTTTRFIDRSPLAPPVGPRQKIPRLPAEETFEMWPKVRAGEFKWIYPNQEGSDYVFNSFMPYELAGHEEIRDAAVGRHRQRIALLSGCRAFDPDAQVLPRYARRMDPVEFNSSGMRDV
jgi:uridine kinase